MFGAKQIKTDEAVVSPSGQDFLYRREAGVWVYLLQSAAVMVFILVGGVIVGWKFGGAILDWSDIFSNAFFAAWLGGFMYFLYSLWRWSKLAWLENALGVNLDRDPRIGNETGGKRPTMYIKIALPNGDVRAADSRMPERNKRYLIWVAQATIAGRPNSQRAMQRGGVYIPRPQHERVMAVYTQLGVLRKENPQQANSRYVIAEPTGLNRAILSAVARGNFEMLEDVWMSKRSK